MNEAYYGHAFHFILSYNANGVFYDDAMPGGIKIVHQMSKNNSVYYAEQDSSSDEFHREYYGMHRYESAKGGYYAASRYLGYRKGKTPNSICNIPPKNPDLPIDILAVWDEGYGGLVLPDDCRYVFWASDKSLPDREQFEKIAAKCFVFLDADVLRSSGAMISRQISWERTAAELIQQIQNNAAINYLFKARYILIAFSVDGAVLIMRKNNQIEASLFLTHGGAEGAVAEKYQGNFLNVFSTMTGQLFLSKTVMLQVLDNENERFSTAVALGNILREIIEVGESFSQKGFKLLEKEGNIDISIITNEIKLRGWDAFPVPLELTANSQLSVPDDWTVTGSIGNKEIYDVAFDYVMEGSKVIEGLPQLSFGALTTVDRWEIEAYQNIRNLIIGYANSESARPLSIAVFGSPGSGKSFGVTQIAKNVLPGKVEKLEFNVSQFTSLASLSAAFHKVRDVALEGKLPLVFFDEFDSDRDGLSLGWIKSFLMPMQDGRFTDDSGEHPLGKCVLVFAGGTASSFEGFIRPLDVDEISGQIFDKKAYEHFKSVKGPDFISRLRGTINVLGPNPKSKDDKNYILRRALLLRGFCERKLKFKQNPAPVNESIVRAMLLVPEYRHGARSMEAILDMSRIEGDTWEPASLPPRSQLALHVNADAFINLVLQSNSPDTAI